MKYNEFRAPLVKILHERLALKVMAANCSAGIEPCGHLLEATVQHNIACLLAPHIPSPDLIQQNKMAYNQGSLCRYIPDVTVNRTDGTPWAYFELKTLLSGDNLNESDVAHDLNKLCKYKKLHPNAHSIFILVGSRKKILGADGTKTWEKAGIFHNEAAFSATPLRPQKIQNDTYFALPCGRSNTNNDVISISWEIRPKRKNMLLSPSSFFQFKAAMIEA